MHFIKIFLLLSSFSALISADLLPVLSYLNTNQQSPNNKVAIGEALSFETVSNNFKNVQDLNVILIDQLNSQDLTQLLRKSTIKNVDFKPLVVNPSDGLNKFIDQNRHINTKVAHSNDLSDAFFRFSELVENSKSVILTGRSNGRNIRLIDELSNETSFFNIFGSQCAASFKKIYMIDQLSTNSSVSLEVLMENSTFICEDTKESNATKSAILTLVFDPSNRGINNSAVVQVSLNMTANKDTGYWTLANGRLITKSNEVYGISYMKPAYKMETPYSYSFVCTNTSYRLYYDDSDKYPGKPFLKGLDFHIEYLQIQPFNMIVNGTDFKYGQINYCQGFFTSGIWMAITVSLLVTLLLSFGISLLMSIKIMDQFDDPKGKPLPNQIEK